MNENELNEQKANIQQEVTTEQPVEVQVTVEQPKPKAKRSPKSTKKEVEPEVNSVSTSEPEVEIEVPKEDSEEVNKLRDMLKAVEAERDKLASECTSLSDTVKALQEEVKITPKKLAKVVQEMGIAPLPISREVTQTMSIEAYNAMSDSQRREWQRKNRSEFLNMMHNVKLGR